MLTRRIKFYHLRKKYIKNYKAILKKNKLIEEFKLDNLFDVKMHFPMFEICDVLNNIGFNKLIKKIYKLKKIKNCKVDISYINSKFKKIDYIRPQYTGTGWAKLADIELLDDSLIKNIHIVWTQINNEEAIIIYEIKFKKWINELKDLNQYVIQNINNLIHFEPTIIYSKDYLAQDINTTYNIVCEMFYTTIQQKISKLFYTVYGKKYLLPILSKYVVERKNKNISKYLKNSFLQATYIKPKTNDSDSNIYLINSFNENQRQYDELIFGKSYSPGSTLLYYFSEYRMEFYYQVFDDIEIHILENKMSKFLNSSKKNIKVTDYKWLIKKVKQLGEKRLYANSYNTNINWFGHSKNVKGKKFINLNKYSRKFEKVYKDNLNYIKEMNSVNYNYKIYIITIITLALTILGTFLTLKDTIRKQENTMSESSAIQDNTNTCVVNSI